MSIFLTIFLVATSTQSPLLVVQAGHVDRVHHIVATRAGTYTVSADPRSAILWDDDGRQLATFRIWAGEPTLSALTLSQDEKQIAIAGRKWIDLHTLGNLIRDKSSTNPKPYLRVILPVDATLKKIQFSSDGKELWALTSGDHLFRVPLDRSPLPNQDPPIIAVQGSDRVAVEVATFAAKIAEDGICWVPRYQTLIRTFGKSKRDDAYPSNWGTLSYLSQSERGDLLASSGSGVHLLEPGKAWRTVVNTQGLPVKHASISRDGTVAAWIVGNRAYTSSTSAFDKAQELPGDAETQSIVQTITSTRILVGGSGGVRRFDPSGKPLAGSSTAMQKRTRSPNAVRVSPNREVMAIGSMDQNLLLWDVEFGRPRSYSFPRSKAGRLAWSPDSRYLAGSHLFGFIIDVQSGNLRRLPDGTTVSMFSSNTEVVGTNRVGEVISFETATGKRRWAQSVGPSSRVLSIGRTGPGQLRVVTSSEDETSLLTLDSASGSILSRRTLSGWPAVEVSVSKTRVPMTRNGPTIRASFSEDGSRFVTHERAEYKSGTQVTESSCFTVWDTATARALGANTAHAGITDVRISPDGRALLIPCEDNTLEYIRVKDLAEGLPYAIRITGPTGKIHSVDWVSFPDNQEQLIMGSDDGTVRAWSVPALEARLANNSPNSGSEDDVARDSEMYIVGLLAPRSKGEVGDWAVTTSQGAFDAPNGGRVEGLHWVVGSQIAPFEDLLPVYYRPGLLAGLRPESEQVLPISQLELPTRAQCEISGDEIIVRIAPDARFDAAWLEVNGVARLALDVNALRTGSTKVSIDHPAIANARRFDLDSPDTIRVITVLDKARESASLTLADEPRAGSATSNSASLPGKVLDRPGRVVALIVGASRLEGKPLPGVERDIEKVKALLEGLSERVEVVSLVSQPNSQVRVSRAEILKAMDRIGSMGLTARDVLVVYFSGHGMAKNGTYEFLVDAPGSEPLSWGDVEQRLLAPLGRRAAIEGSAVDQAPMPRIAMIVDTCFAGSMRENFKSWQVKDRALAQPSRDLGLFLLAASKEGETVLSFESDALGHGIMTFSVLDWATNIILESQNREGLLDLTPIFQTGSSNPVKTRAERFSGQRQIMSVFNVSDQQLSLGIAKKEPFLSLLHDLSLPVMLTPDVSEASRESNLAVEIQELLEQEDLKLLSKAPYVFSATKAKRCGYRFFGRFEDRNGVLTFTQARLDYRWLEAGSIREESIEFLTDLGAIPSDQAARRIADAIAANLAQHQLKLKSRRP